MGGTNDDKPTALALQPDGELVVAGYTLSSDFPIRAALQSELKGNSSAFIARFGARSGELQSSTFFGGSGDDSALGMALAQNGDIHIVGLTRTLAGLATISPGSMGRTSLSIRKDARGS